MLHKLLFSRRNFSSLYPKRNFHIDYLKDIQIITNDYCQSLKHIYESFSTHKIKLSDIQTMKLNRTDKDQRLILKLTVEERDSYKFNKLYQELQNGRDEVLTNKNSKIPIVPWFPRDENDVKSLGLLMVVNEENNQYHPQFTDQEYRERREQIAKISEQHVFGQKIPSIDYTQQEEATWKKIYSILREKGNPLLAKRYLKNLEKIEKALGFKYKVPQLNDIDAYLRAETGFRIKATHGILSQREFLNALAHRVFCCTQYIRHHAYPEYSPEPDLIHEVVGHIPLFADKEIADLSQEIGILSCGVEQKDLSRLGTLYWFTLEFGACKENGQIKGYGAGIASSTGELDNFHIANYEKFDPFIHADRTYPTQIVQPTYLYCESFDEVIQELRMFGQSLQKPFGLYYDFVEKELKATKVIQTHLQNP
ncbi:unnamed protein product (macronuclear) [Paramecium tetraurelia]|uniref:phenylalanine 4-monooxygenase n=1 Tax=Paramecium tetraurelia TaxID=5888 RepID=A0DG89_PARTE|nr:uncharacterized protein GSPATT00002185001 [Paramecium tetraurelia]CAK82056.1 unnamed protein product [Paramecium tetraurelia]|eukprot:XP_001449453.1 hypothetical protein (macronuclear) [Paramecium tetraurelia strain d4-2]